MLKGDLIKKEGVWHVIYSSENIGKINEIKVTDYSSKMISEKKGDNIKYFKDVYFDMTRDGMAIIKFMPDPPPTKMVREGKKQKASKKLRELYDTPFELKNNPHIIDNSPKLDKPFSEQEEEVMNLLIEAHTKFSQLEQTHPSDINDWVFHLHGRQRLLGQRLLRRDYPHIFITKK